MSTKKKKLARALSKKSGMSHQAAVNALPQIIRPFSTHERVTFSARCKRCQRWICAGDAERGGACTCGGPYRIEFVREDWGRVREDDLVMGDRCMDCGAEFRLTPPAEGRNPWHPVNVGQSQCDLCFVSRNARTATREKERLTASLASDAMLVELPPGGEHQITDDLEADEATVVLRMYWPIGQRLAEATNEWAQCHDESRDHALMQECLKRTLEAAKTAANEIPRDRNAQFPCGVEIEDAHRRYIESQIIHLTRMVEWVDRHAEDLTLLMRDNPLAEVWTDIGDGYPIDTSYGYAQVMAVERTKSLFQCGPENNVAWINKVAARLRLGPDLPGGGPLRVRSSQRLLVA